jgi:hypothetical protein
MPHLSKRFQELKMHVDLVNRLSYPTLLKGRELSLSGSQTKGYSVYFVTPIDRQVLGTVVHGNYNEVVSAINAVARTIQILSK